MQFIKQSTINRYYFIFTPFIDHRRLPGRMMSSRVCTQYDVIVLLPH